MRENQLGVYKIKEIPYSQEVLLNTNKMIIAQWLSIKQTNKNRI